MFKMNNNNNDWTIVGEKNKNTVKTVNRFSQQNTQAANTVKTVFATGPTYHSQNSVVVSVPTYNRKITVTPIDTSKPKTKKELMSEKNKLLDASLKEIYAYDKKRITNMIEEHKKNKQYDHKKGGLVTNLQPILISHYDRNNVNRYSVLSSQKFRESVIDHFSQFDVDVVLNNDPDNEVWRIVLYIRD